MPNTTKKRKIKSGNFPGGPGKMLCFHCWAAGLISDCRTEISHAMQCDQKNRKKNVLIVKRIKSEGRQPFLRKVMCLHNISRQFCSNYGYPLRASVLTLPVTLIFFPECSDSFCFKICTFLFCRFGYFFKFLTA